MIYERPIGMATPTVNELEDEIAEMEADNQKLRDIIKEVISTVEKDFPIFAAAIQKQLEDK